MRTLFVYHKPLGSACTGDFCSLQVNFASWSSLPPPPGVNLAVSTDSCHWLSSVNAIACHLLVCVENYWTILVLTLGADSGSPTSSSPSSVVIQRDSDLLNCVFYVETEKEEIGIDYCHLFKQIKFKRKIKVWSRKIFHRGATEDRWTRGTVCLSRWCNRAKRF